MAEDLYLLPSASKPKLRKRVQPAPVEQIPAQQTPAPVSDGALGQLLEGVDGGGLRLSDESINAFKQRARAFANYVRERLASLRRLYPGAGSDDVTLPMD